MYHFFAMDIHLQTNQVGCNLESANAFRHLKVSVLQIFLEELLNFSDSGILVGTLGLDGDGIALLNGQAHQLHQLGSLGFLVTLNDHNSGVGKTLCQLRQHAGGTGMDAQGIIYSISKFFYFDYSYPYFTLNSLSPTLPVPVNNSSKAGRSSELVTRMAEVEETPSAFSISARLKVNSS